MSDTACPREQEIVQAVLAGAWSSVDDQELQAHTSQCASCAEIATIAALMREDNEHARREVRVPAAGQVWWRAAVRARLETSQAATRPMTWMHGITAAIAIGILLTVLTLAWPSITANAQGLVSMFTTTIPNSAVAGAMLSAFRQSIGLAIIVTAFLILAPVALYFALSD